MRGYVEGWRIMERIGNSKREREKEREREREQNEIYI